MIRQAAKFLALSWPEKKVIFTAFILLPAFWIALRIFGLARFKAWIERPVVPSAIVPREQLVSRGRLFNIAAFYSPGPVTCLTRSLLLHWSFRREGIASQLRIGARVAAGRLNAHAWVEFAGEPVNDAPDVAGRYDARF